VRATHRPEDAGLDTFVTRLLIEAVEGCGIRHWARIDSWDGATAADITDLGGETFRLDAGTIGPTLDNFVAGGPRREPLDVDSYIDIADEIIQTALFGCVIYRTTVRRRPHIEA